VIAGWHFGYGGKPALIKRQTQSATQADMRSVTLSSTPHPTSLTSERSNRRASCVRAVPLRPSNRSLATIVEQIADDRRVDLNDEATGMLPASAFEPVSRLPKFAYCHQMPQDYLIFAFNIRHAENDITIMDALAR
jgi:hypothetical protein